MKQIIIFTVFTIILSFIMLMPIPIHVVTYEDLPPEEIKIYQLCIYFIIFSRYKLFIISSFAIICIFLLKIWRLFF